MIDVHFDGRRDVWDARKAACGAEDSLRPYGPAVLVTKDLDRVTCAACKKTDPYKDAEKRSEDVV